ncbi:MAG: hypothetical protein HKO91_02975 [Desulfobacterales bacterium]|nr:hypothetical protein [Desulfobacterales bacterium]
MDDKKDNRNVGLNFPRGNVEEMLRMMRKCREEGNIDCEIIMKEFMGKRVRSVDYKQIKKKLFRENSK